MSTYDLGRLLALAEQLSPHLSGPSAAMLARQLSEIGIAETLNGTVGTDDIDAAWLTKGLDGITPDRTEYWLSSIDRFEENRITVHTVADELYPRNLRLVNDQPPLLFMKGSVIDADEKAMAVVGTRNPTPEGEQAAKTLAAQLAERGVTVVSGLARGIDTAAHQAALAAGGRTLAVFGTGIGSVSPVGNRALASRIEASGACLSQFWPAQSGAPWTFPIRNIVTSGLSLGTVVVEAGVTSGARLQAQDALRHGKRLFLLRRLVSTFPWAQAMVDRPGVTVVKKVDEVIEAIEFDFRVPELDLVRS
jgi:DNA processing protein